MPKLLSIFLALTVVVMLVALIGVVMRTPRFAVLREQIERQVRSAGNPAADEIEPEPIPQV